MVTCNTAELRTCTEKKNHLLQLDLPMDIPVFWCVCVHHYFPLTNLKILHV